MAEFVKKDLVKKSGQESEFEIASAATSREEIGNDIHPGTKTKLKQQHIPFEKRHARQITKRDYDYYDLIIGMDSYNIRNMGRILGVDVDHKIYSLLEFAGSKRDIAEPWYTGNFDETYSDVLEGCSALLDVINHKKMGEVR